jgi:hypothetical protein
MPVFQELADLFTDLPRQKAPLTGAVSAPAGTGAFLPARMPAVPIVILAVVVLDGDSKAGPGRTSYEGRLPGQERPGRRHSAA